MVRARRRRAIKPATPPPNNSIIPGSGTSMAITPPLPVPEGPSSPVSPAFVVPGAEPVVPDPVPMLVVVPLVPETPPTLLPPVAVSEPAAPVPEVPVPRLPVPRIPTPPVGDAPPPVVGLTVALVPPAVAGPVMRGSSVVDAEPAPPPIGDSGISAASDVGAAFAANVYLDALVARASTPTSATAFDPPPVVPAHEPVAAVVTSLACDTALSALLGNPSAELATADPPFNLYQ